MKANLLSTPDPAHGMRERYRRNQALEFETEQELAHSPVVMRRMKPAVPRRRRRSWIARKIARAGWFKHAVVLWFGGTPARRPGRLELAVTPLMRSWITIAPMIASDVLALLIATLLSFCFLRAFGPVPLRGIHQIMPIVSATLVAGFLSGGLYSVIGVNPVVELRQFTRLTTLVLIVAMAASYLIGARSHWRTLFLLEWLFSLALLPSLRGITRRFIAGTAWWGQPAIVFGHSQEAFALAKLLIHEPACGVRPVALVDNDDTYSLDSYPMPVLNHRRARLLVRRARFSYGVVLDSHDRTQRQAAIARALSIPLSHVLVMSTNAELPSLWRDTCECAGMPAVEVQNRLIMPWPRIVKRFSDLTLTILGGIAILPVLLIVAVLVKLTSRGPIFFGHTRIGKNGRRFKAWKFRTMVENAPAILEKYLAENPDLREEWEQDHKLKNDPRVTPLGRLLRKTSLDEFPQLWNVLRGEMSLVGPRPIVKDEIEKYGDIFDKYMRVKPGITGLWQVSGRNNTTYLERIKFDEYYVRNWSPWLDLHLLTRTLSSLLYRDGAY